MSKKHMFASRGGTSIEVKVDPKHIDRQVRDLKSQGYEVTVMDEAERIRMGLLSQQIAKAHREGRI
jgi:hypothetical protein